MRKVIKTVEVTFDEVQAFRTLCEVLDIDRLVLSEEQLYIHKGKVCRRDKDGNFEVVDDRADLFCALRNVLNALAPNLHFRSDHYITNWGDECPTNGDMIRRMSDRELADKFGKQAGFACEYCDPGTGTCYVMKDCPAAFLRWLQDEADTEEES